MLPVKSTDIRVESLRIREWLFDHPRSFDQEIVENGLVSFTDFLCRGKNLAKMFQEKFSFGVTCEYFGFFIDIDYFPVVRRSK